jgi:hypothetical protein
MKIGYFTTHFPYKTYLNKEYAEQYSCGGTENVAYHLAYNIAMEGHETTIFTTSIDFKESVETYNNARIYRYGKTFAIGSAGMSNLIEVFKNLAQKHPKIKFAIMR